MKHHGENGYAANIGLAIWRLHCFYETFLQSSTLVILLNFCAKIPPHRQAENRYAQAYDSETKNKFVDYILPVVI